MTALSPTNPHAVPSPPSAMQAAAFQPPAVTQDTIPDPAAVFAALYTEHAAAILRHCRRRLHDPNEAYTAEDAAQETWRKAWEALPAQLAAPAQFRSGPWLYRIATNVCNDAARHREVIARNAPALTAEAIEIASATAAPIPEAHVVALAVAAETRGLAGAVFECLPWPARTVLWQYEYARLSYNEIAALSETTRIAIKSRLFRARELFDAALERERLLAAGQISRGWGLLTRFETLSRRRGSNDCWLWGGHAERRDGYPHVLTYYCPPREPMQWRQVTKNAQRIAWAIAHGPLPPKARVITTCGTRTCVNPAHLALASARPRSGSYVPQPNLADWIEQARTAAKRALRLRQASSQSGEPNRGGTPNRTGARYVTYRPKYGTYAVSIPHQRRHLWIGTWPTLEEAREVALDLHRQLEEARALPAPAFPVTPSLDQRKEAR